MDGQVKNCCPKCSQEYAISNMRPLKGRIPLLLPCNHAACDSCIRSALKLNEPLQCPLCEHLVELAPDRAKVLAESLSMSPEFPVCVYIFGHLAFELGQHNIKIEPQDHYNAYIDLKEIIQSTDICTKKCNECNNMTRFRCKDCRGVYCDACFTKLHSSFESLKSHTKEELGMEKCKAMCLTHDKPLEFYCETCQKPLCVNCLLLGDKECATHKTMSIQERNSCYLDKVKEAYEQVDEIYRRLTKTAVDIGNNLDMKNAEMDTNSHARMVARAIQEHYTQLHAILQKQECEKLSALGKLMNEEKHSLEQLKGTVADSIRAAKTLMSNIKFVLNNGDVKINYSDLLQEAEKIINTPWYLQRSEPTDSKPSFKLNDNLFQALEEHLKLEEDLQQSFTLLPTKDITAELPLAPLRPVYPPEMVQDVRVLDKKSANKKNEDKKKEAAPRPKASIDFVPSFSSKTASNSSLNSVESTKSTNKFDPPPKTLEEGGHEMVYVVHINSPGDFYVHRVCLLKRLREMKNEFASASSFHKPQLSKVCEGNLFLGLCKLSNQFQRCRIISINKKNPEGVLFNVFYIDSGQTDCITIKELRKLSGPASLEPGMALHCVLANVRPLGSQWEPEDVLLMHQIVSNKKAVMYIRSTLGATNLGLALECDLITFDDGVNLARALVFHERARFVDPLLKPPKVGLKEELPKLFYNPDMKKGSTEEVVVTYIYSPDKFYIRKSYLQKQFEKLCDDLDSVYGHRKDKSSFVFCPEVGMVVACNTEKFAEQLGEDGGPGWGWRRGQVVAPAGKARVLLTLPDSGHELTMHVSSLRVLQQHYYAVKALAVECHLSMISPTNKKWSAASVTALENYAERPLQAFVTEPAGRQRSMGVVLYDHSDSDQVLCVNEEFIKSKFAVNIGALTFQLPNAPKTVQDKAPTGKVKPPKVPHVRILKNKSRADKTISEKKLQVTVDRGPVKLEVKILSSQTPSQLYVSLVSHQEQLIELYKCMQPFYDTTPPPGKEDWQPEERCCVFHKESKTWRRARVLETHGDRARVFHTDFAVADDLPLAELRPLHSEFQEILNGAHKCHLAGVMPAGGDRWPGITCEYLESLIEEYGRFFITKTGPVVDNSMPVQLWVYHVTPGDALNPDTGEWRLLNTKLVEQGLAIPDHTAAAAVPEDTLSLLAATGTVSEWLQLYPSSANSAASASASAPAELDESTEPELASPQRTAPLPPHEDWLPANAVTVTQFQAIPTYVSNDGHIYIHDADNDGLLHIIKQSLNSYHNKNEKGKDKEWVEGQPCIALYGLDETFYRGRVTQVIDTSNCLVEFVDYGNVEVVPMKHMRKKLVMGRIPIVALKCTLSAINLIGGTKRTQAADYAQDIIVDKVCPVKIFGYREDVLEIELWIKNQKLSDLLVDIHYATYIKNNFIEVKENDQDLDPDYIIEDDSSSDTLLNNTNKPMETVDWNKMIDEANKEEQINKVECLTYPTVEVPTDANGNFRCTVEVMTSVTQLQLRILEPRPDESEALAEILTEIQEEGPSRPVIGELRAHKACIALYGDDGTWYRAAVLQQDLSKGVIKVLYVDFGNWAIVPRTDVRESKERWCLVAPSVVEAKLYGVSGTDACHNPTIKETFKRLMDGELVATVLDRKDNDLHVELRKEVGQPVLYQEFIDGNVLRKCRDEEDMLLHL